MDSSKNKHFSEKLSVFQDRRLPEYSNLVGYSAIINYYNLNIPLPHNLCAVSDKNKAYSENNWKIYSSRHMPQDNLEGHLTFALKYEGVDLLVLKFLFKVVDKVELEKIILNKPNSSYLRRIWFFYEWLMEIKLDIPDLKQGNYVDAVDQKLQFCVEAEEYIAKAIYGDLGNSKRHRIQNNLPNNNKFCPLVSKTDAILKFQEMALSKVLKKIVENTNVNILDRAYSHLLLKDTKSSYEIEKEKPPRNKLERWGYVVSQAGKHDLDEQELDRLQNIVIQDTRFTKMGVRDEEAFIGVHNRYNEPSPDHIAAKSSDLKFLIEGLVDFDKLHSLNKNCLYSLCDEIVNTAIISFGFVFIHPFSDGNGRIHRYLIHHMLAKLNYTPDNIIFPISSIILDNLDKYREVLESYSKPLLKYIDWEPDEDGNIRILNDTIDYYRYFDATKMVEFLYECIETTITKELPEQIEFLEKYDRFKNIINNDFYMPDRVIEKLYKFLKQEDGKLSKRALSKEFNSLEDNEIKEIEGIYDEVFK